MTTGVYQTISRVPLSTKDFSSYENYLVESALARLSGQLSDGRLYVVKTQKYLEENPNEDWQELRIKIFVALKNWRDALVGEHCLLPGDINFDPFASIATIEADEKLLRFRLTYYEKSFFIWERIE